MVNRIILALCLLGTLLDLSQADSMEALKKHIETNLQKFVDEGLENAEEILKKEETVSRNSSDQPITRKLSQNKQANSKSKVASACKGLARIEISKVIVQVLESLGVDKKNISKLLDSIDMSSSAVQYNTINVPLCYQSRSAPLSTCDPTYAYRLIDGSCNNIHTGKGASGIKFKRLLPADYDDSVETIRKAKLTGEPLPNARNISYLLSQISITDPEDERITQMVKAWGQFIDHDITQTPETQAPPLPYEQPRPLPCCDDGNPTPWIETTADCLQIDVSEDPFYQNFGVNCLRFVRSLIAPPHGHYPPLGARDQLNQVTSFIDASQVYGSTTERENELRDPVAGRMRVNEASEVPYCSCSPACLQFLPETSPKTVDDFFIAGDIRVNEQPGLTSMHTAFVRLHNLIASKFLQISPALTDESIYQETRRIVAAIIQKITFAEFLPIVLGNNAMQLYDLELSSSFSGYDNLIDPSLANAFASAAYRFGHSLVGPHLGVGVNEIPLAEVFFDTEFLKFNNPALSDLLKAESLLPSQSLDANLITTLTNRLFADGPAFDHGLDLMAFNIMRGRDHGLPGYNDWRDFCNLTTFSSFPEMVPELSPDAVGVFSSLYTDVDDVDVFPAGLAEIPVGDALIGPTFVCILAQQFSDLKFGDRFWLENPSQPEPFTAAQLAAIRDMCLATVLCEVTTIYEIQEQPMLRENSATNKIKPCSHWKKHGVLANLHKFT